MYSIRRSMDEQSGGRAGHKKGAHYSAPMLAGPLPRIRALADWPAVGPAALPACSGVPGRSVAADPRPKATPRRRRPSCRRSSPRSSASPGRSARNRSSGTGSPESCARRKCRSAKRARVWKSVRHERAERAAQARRRWPPQKRDARSAIWRKDRVALAGQLRAAYLIGHEEPLKLLLNQKDPARAGRMFVYYSYFGRARAEQIHAIETNVQTACDGSMTQLAARTQKLAELEKQQRADLTELEQARSAPHRWCWRT